MLLITKSANDVNRKKFALGKNLVISRTNSPVITETATYLLCQFIKSTGVEFANLMSSDGVQFYAKLPGEV